MTQAASFVAAARAYLRVPFRHMGRNRHGLDCVGLLLLAARDAGIVCDEPEPYERGRRGWDIRDWLRQRLDEQPRDGHRDGDVLLFNDGMYPAHVGVRSTWHLRPAVIHAHLRHNQVVEEPLENDIRRSLRGVFRLRAG